MGTYASLDSGQGGGGTYRQADGQARAAPKPAAKGGDPRKSADYQALMAAAGRTRDVTDKALGSIPLLGSMLKRTRDEGMGALAGLPFSDEAVGLADKGLTAGANLFRRAAGAPEIDPEAAYLAGKDFTNQSKTAALKDSPISARSTEALAMVAGPGKALKAAKAIPAVRAAGEVAAKAAPGLLEGAGNLVAKIAPKGSLVRSAGVGGLLGGVYGAGEGEGLEERAINTAQGLLGGTALGAGMHMAAPYVVPVAKAIGEGAGKLGKIITKPFGAEVDPATIEATPAQLEQARQAAVKLAARSGLTSPAEVIERAAQQFGDKPVTAAELLGRQGVTQLGAVGRRSGATPQELEGLLRGRSQGAAERIKGDFQGELGVNPDEAAGDIDAIVAAAQERANPLYREALAGEHGVTNPELEEIQSRPVVQRAMREVQNDFRNRVKGSTGLAMGRVEVPEPAAGVHPLDAPPVGEVPIGPGAEPPPIEPTPEVKVPRGPAEPPSRGPSLLTFLRNKGMGIDDTGGDLAGQGLRINLRQGGAELDDLAEQAGTAGYFPELQGQRPTRNQLIDAMLNHHINPRYAREAEAGAQGRFEARAAGEEQNRTLSNGDHERQQASDAAFRAEQARQAEQAAAWERQQAEVGPHQEDWRSLETGTETPEGGGAGINAPRYEPADQEALTPAAWDAVKKKVGNLVTRDDAGRPILSGPVQGRNQGYLDASQDLVEALTRPGALGPKYRQALDAAMEKLGTKKAFDRISGKLTTGDMRTFGRLWASLRTEGERAAGRAALANDVVNMADRGLLRGGKFATPGIQRRLELAFGGKGNVEQFLTKVDAEASLARTGGRMMPGTGSGTAEWTQAIGGEGENPLETVGEVAGHVASGSPLGAAKAALKAYGLKVLSYSRTAGTPVQVLDEYGRILMLDPEGFAQFLATRDPASLRVVHPPAGKVGGLTSGYFQGEENR